MPCWATRWLKAEEKKHAVPAQPRCGLYYGTFGSNMLPLLTNLVLEHLHPYLVNSISAVQLWCNQPHCSQPEGAVVKATLAFSFYW